MENQATASHVKAMFYKAIYKPLQLLTRTRGLTKNGSRILMQNHMLPGHHFQWKILKKKKKIKKMDI